MLDLSVIFVFQRSSDTTPLVIEKNNMSEKVELLVSFMLKRSLNRRAFTKENYKHRFFVLYPTCLKYYDGAIDVSIRILFEDFQVLQS